MPEEPLQGRQRNISLYGGNGKGMPQDVWRYRPTDARVVCHALDDALNGARTHTEGIVERKVSLYQGLYPRRERDNPALGFTPVGATLSIYHKTVPLPLDVVTAEA